MKIILNPNTRSTYFIIGYNHWWSRYQIKYMYMFRKFRYVSYFIGITHILLSYIQYYSVLQFTREMPQINMSRSVLWPYIDDKSTNNYTIVTDMEGNIRIYGLPTNQWRLYCRRQRKYQLHSPYHDPRAVCLFWYCPPYQYIFCLLHWRPESDTHNIDTQNLLKESGIVIWTAILGLNKTLHTKKMLI